jgi:hypothetical protein
VRPPCTAPTPSAASSTSSSPGLHRYRSEGVLRRPDARRWRRRIGNATLTAGWGDLTKDKFNIFGSIYYQKAEALDQNKRNFSDSSLDLDQGLVGVSGNTFPGFITTGGIGSIGYPNCAPSIPGGDLGARCFYDPAAADGVNSIPETETTSVFVSGKWQFNPDWQAYGTFATRSRKTASSSSRRRCPTRSRTVRTRNSSRDSCCRRRARTTRRLRRSPPASTVSR